MTFEDAYSILNVYPDCTLAEAREAYRTAALKHHPDRHPPHRRAEAERRFKVFAQAYLTICKDLGHELEAGELNPPKTISGLVETPGALAIRRAARYARESPTTEEKAAISAAVAHGRRDVIPREARPSAAQQVMRRDPRHVTNPARPQYREEVCDEPEEDDEEEEEEEDEEEEEEEDEDDNDDDDDDGERQDNDPPKPLPLRAHSNNLGPDRRPSANQIPTPRERERERERYDPRRDSRVTQHPVRRATEPSFGSSDNWMQSRGIGKPAYNNGGFFNGGTMAMPPMGGGGMGGMGGGMGLQMSLGSNGGDPFSQITGMIDNMSRVNVQDPAFGKGGGGLMNMRSSRMTMTQGDDGEWRGQKHNRAMKIGDGQMDVSEDGTELYMPGQSFRARQHMSQGRDVDPSRSRQVKPGTPKSVRKDLYEYQDAPPAYRGPDPRYHQQDDYVNGDDHDDYYPQDDYTEPVRRSTAPSQSGQERRVVSVPVDRRSSDQSPLSTPRRASGGRGYATMNSATKLLRDSPNSGSNSRVQQMTVRGSRGDVSPMNSPRGAAAGAIETRRGDRTAIEGPTSSALVKRGPRGGPVVRA